MSDYKLVPVEPTAEMVEAAQDAHMPFGDMDLALRMAILAAPDVQGEPVAWVTADTVDGQAVSGKPRRVWWENNEGVGMPIYTAPQPAPDVAALVEVLETALFGTPLDDVPNRDNDDIWCMCYPHLPERASDALRDHLARIETALAAHLKGGEK